MLQGPLKVLQKSCEGASARLPAGIRPFKLQFYLVSATTTSDFSVNSPNDSSHFTSLIEIHPNGYIYSAETKKEPPFTLDLTGVCFYDDTRPINDPEAVASLEFELKHAKNFGLGGQQQDHLDGAVMDSATALANQQQNQRKDMQALELTRLMDPDEAEEFKKLRQFFLDHDTNESAEMTHPSLNGSVNFLTYTGKWKFADDVGTQGKLAYYLAWLYKHNVPSYMVEHQTQFHPYMEDLDLNAWSDWDNLGEFTRPTSNFLIHHPDVSCEPGEFLKQRALALHMQYPCLEEIYAVVLDAGGYQTGKKMLKCSYHILWPQIFVKSDVAHEKKDPNKTKTATTIRNFAVDYFSALIRVCNGRKTVGPLWDSWQAILLHSHPHGTLDEIFDGSVAENQNGLRMPYSDKGVQVNDADGKTVEVVIENRPNVPIGVACFRFKREVIRDKYDNVIRIPTVTHSRWVAEPQSLLIQDWIKLGSVRRGKSDSTACLARPLPPCPTPELETMVEMMSPTAPHNQWPVGRDWDFYNERLIRPKMELKASITRKRMEMGKLMARCAHKIEQMERVSRGFSCQDHVMEAPFRVPFGTEAAQFGFREDQAVLESLTLDCLKRANERRNLLAHGIDPDKKVTEIQQLMNSDKRVTEIQQLMNSVGTEDSDASSDTSSSNDSDTGPGPGEKDTNLVVNAAEAADIKKTKEISKDRKPNSKPSKTKSESASNQIEDSDAPKISDSDDSENSSTKSNSDADSDSEGESKSSESASDSDVSHSGAAEFMFKRQMTVIKYREAKRRLARCKADLGIQRLKTTRDEYEVERKKITGVLQKNREESKELETKIMNMEIEETECKQQIKARKKSKAELTKKVEDYGSKERNLKKLYETWRKKDQEALLPKNTVRDINVRLVVSKASEMQYKLYYNNSTDLKSLVPLSNLEDLTSLDNDITVAGNPDKVVSIAAFKRHVEQTVRKKSREKTSEVFEQQFWVKKNLNSTTKDAADASESLSPEEAQDKEKAKLIQEKLFLDTAKAELRFMKRRDRLEIGTLDIEIDSFWKKKLGELRAAKATAQKELDVLEGEERRMRGEVDKMHEKAEKEIARVAEEFVVKKELKNGPGYTKSSNLLNKSSQSVSLSADSLLTGTNLDEVQKLRKLERDVNRHLRAMQRAFGLWDGGPKNDPKNTSNCTEDDAMKLEWQRQWREHREQKLIQLKQLEEKYLKAYGRFPEQYEKLGSRDLVIAEPPDPDSRNLPRRYQREEQIKPPKKKIHGFTFLSAKYRLKFQQKLEKKQRGKTVTDDSTKENAEIIISAQEPAFDYNKPLKFLKYSSETLSAAACSNEISINDKIILQLIKDY